MVRRKETFEKKLEIHYRFSDSRRVSLLKSRQGDKSKLADFFRRKRNGVISRRRFASHFVYVRI